MIASYFSYLTASQKSANTIRSYTKAIEKMLDFIDKKEEGIVYNDLLEYQAHLSSLSTNTVCLHLSAIKSYFSYLYRSGILTSNPAENLEKPHVNSKPKPYMNMNMIHSMIENTRTIRDKAIISFICSTGVRVSELINITLSDYYNAETTHEILIMGKGKKERVIYINEETDEYIKEYLKTRTDFRSPYLFSSFQGGQIHSNNLSQTIKKVAKKANVPFWESISNHTLRSAFATIASEKNVPVATIKEAMGHSSISTTSIYIKNSQENINRAMASMIFC